MTTPTTESMRPTPGAVRAAIYETAYHSADHPQWVTRIHHGPYVAYSYTRDAADRLTDLLNDREKIRTDLVNALHGCESMLLMCRDHFAEGPGMTSWAAMCIKEVVQARAAIARCERKVP